jgi:hypothetical protein
LIRLALLIASLAEIAERPYTQHRQAETLYEENITDSVLGETVNPLFNPLQPSEEPGRLLAGSNEALATPLSHLWKYVKLSFYLPWPFGVWPVGLRHQLRPPMAPNKVNLEERSAIWDSTKRCSIPMGGGDTDNDNKPEEEVVERIISPDMIKAVEMEA